MPHKPNRCIVIMPLSHQLSLPTTLSLPARGVQPRWLAAGSAEQPFLAGLMWRHGVRRFATSKATLSHRLRSDSVSEVLVRCHGKGRFPQDAPACNSSDSSFCSLLLESSPEHPRTSKNITNIRQQSPDQSMGSAGRHVETAIFPNLQHLRLYLSEIKFLCKRKKNINKSLGARHMAEPDEPHCDWRESLAALRGRSD